MINDAGGGGGAMQIVGKCFQTQRRMRQYVEPKMEATAEKKFFFFAARVVRWHIKTNMGWRAAGSRLVETARDGTAR